MDGGERARELVDGMIARGVLVRDRSKDPYCPNCFRITTGVVEHTQQAVEALEASVRKAVIERVTARNADPRLRFNLDGTGRFDNHTGVRFLDHMLDLVARHGAFDLDRRAHAATSTSISITPSRMSASRSARPSSKALGDRKGINRAGYFVMPMDETLAVAAIDLGGRPHTVVDTKVTVRLVGDLQTELVHDFFEGFAMGARANVHLKVMYGRSNHHKIEACFKAFARALRVACAKDKRMAKMLPSTKGLL